MEVDRQPWLMTYGYCRCRTFLLAALFPRGRCGRCGTSPEGNFKTREAAEAQRR